MKKRYLKMFVMFGSALILSSGFLAAEYSGRNQTTARKNLENQNQSQFRVLFIDEDGDGICDFFMDHDGDGIPNGQDPDWTKSQGKSGNQIQAQKGKNSAGSQAANKSQFRGAQSSGLNKRSFRNGGSANGICSGANLQGQARRSGKK